MSQAVLKDEVVALIGAIRQLFHLLGATASALHAENELSAPMRSVLESLRRAGPATVPALARERSVSRQHIQRTVDELLAKRLVQLADNPAHRRSPHVVLSPKGESALRDVSAREKPVLDRLARNLSESEARTALRALGKLKSALAPLVPKPSENKETQK